MTVKASGFAFWFFGIFVAASAFGGVYFLADGFRNGFHAAHYLTLLILAYFIYSFGIQLLQRIKLSHGMLTVHSTFAQESTFMPKLRGQDIKLVDIKNVIVGRPKFVLENGGDDSEFKKLVDRIANLKVAVPPGGVSAPVGLAAKHVPMMLIKSANSSVRSIALTLKPYSKKAVSGLLESLRKQGISVMAEE